MFPFAHGLGYANLSKALHLASTSAKITDEVSLSVAITRHDALALQQDTVVAIFGSFLTADETASPVVAMPVRQLLAFKKVTLSAAAASSSQVVKLRFNVSAIPGVYRQPWPGVLCPPSLLILQGIVLPPF